jgi:hypothetical protein
MQQVVWIKTWIKTKQKWHAFICLIESFMGHKRFAHIHVPKVVNEMLTLHESTKELLKGFSNLKSENMLCALKVWMETKQVDVHIRICPMDE